MEVANFLRGLPLPRLTTDGPPPNVRRRTDDPGPSASPASGPSQVSSSSSTDESASRERSASTVGTTPSPPPSNGGPVASDMHIPSVPVNSTLPGANPFGYLDGASNYPPAPPPTVLQSSYTSTPMLTSWGPTPGSMFANGSEDYSQMQMPVQAEPIHPYAYVTFGSGMRQKEIDTYTAQHKLEARYITGSGDGIPYHVPL